MSTTYVAVTPTLVKATSPGKTSAGTLSIPGLQVGDILIKTIPDGFCSGYEDVVSVVDQINQNTDLDWSPVVITFLFLRGV
jgi:hypothetical protein